MTFSEVKETKKNKVFPSHGDRQARNKGYSEESAKVDNSKNASY